MERPQSSSSGASGRRVIAVMLSGALPQNNGALVQDVLVVDYLTKIQVVCRRVRDRSEIKHAMLMSSTGAIFLYTNFFSGFVPLSDGYSMSRCGLSCLKNLRRSFHLNRSMPRTRRSPQILLLDRSPCTIPTSWVSGKIGQVGQAPSQHVSESAFSCCS